MELVPWNFRQAESELGQEIILNSSVPGHFSLTRTPYSGHLHLKIPKEEDMKVTADPACWVLGTNSIKHFHNMTQSPSHSLKSFYNVPTLSAIVHESNALNFEDGFFLPSSFHGRTWLLDNFQEICTENTSCKVPRGEQELGTGDSCVQSAYLRRVVQETCPDFKPCEKTAGQSGSPLAALECVSQPCQSGSSQQMGFAVQTCQPLSNMAKCCPPKTYVSKGCQTLECDSRQCQSRSSESHSCSPLGYVTPEPELLGSSSNTYEPICCVTGGLQLPSK
ncbi:LOW QUALITY PROTEIN: keratin-associated protein 27-1 [Phacochoerus africanus]|uniref:LOW QUALITY PROTEIN: keratin-associated protein 27-1 n=1 Tax=Phacochoerus africanus TaxID=41426 RepID=UPI001FD9C45C|nr:LOW QUALITY PROTEIN: keratin-associated protein 27-1 [Phacochoerus africanus]